MSSQSSCVSWDLMSSQNNDILTESFVMKFDRYINFTLLSEHFVFSILLMRIYSHRLNWEAIIKRQKIEENILQEFSSFFNKKTWATLDQYQNLSDRFKYNFKNKLYPSKDYEKNEYDEKNLIQSKIIAPSTPKLATNLENSTLLLMGLNSSSLPTFDLKEDQVNNYPNFEVTSNLNDSKKSKPTKPTQIPLNSSTFIITFQYRNIKNEENGENGTQPPPLHSSSSSSRHSTNINIEVFALLYLLLILSASRLNI